MARCRFIVTQELDGKRVDQAIAAQVPALSRTRAKTILDQGGVFVDRKRVKIAGRQVWTGQSIEVNTFGEETPRKRQEQTAPDPRIVFQSTSVVVVDKPSGLFSAPTPESDTHDLLYVLRTSLREKGSPPSPEKLHLVHRLDRPTSGLMVIAKNRTAAAALSGQVARRAMKRIYLALIAGTPPEEVTVHLPIQKKEAKTSFTRLETKKGISLVSAELDTGRTHQVRIHADSLGMPVAGDSKYGRQALCALSSRPPRLALHAHQLTFYDPHDGKKLTFQSPFPEELMRWFDSAQLASS